MTLIPASKARRTETPNAVMTTLASPTLGAAGRSLWRVDMRSRPGRARARVRRRADLDRDVRPGNRRGRRRADRAGRGRHHRDLAQRHPPRRGRRPRRGLLGDRHRGSGRSRKPSRRDRSWLAGLDRVSEAPPIDIAASATSAGIVRGIAWPVSSHVDLYGGIDLDDAPGPHPGRLERGGAVGARPGLGAEYVPRGQAATAARARTVAAGSRSSAIACICRSTSPPDAQRPHQRPGEHERRLACRPAGAVPVGWGIAPGAPRRSPRAHRSPGSRPRCTARRLRRANARRVPAGGVLGDRSPRAGRLISALHE